MSTYQLSMRVDAFVAHGSCYQLTVDAALHRIQQGSHEQTIGNTSKIQDSRQKDDEIVLFGLEPSIYLLYILPSLPSCCLAARRKFFGTCHIFLHRSLMLHVTPLSDIADCRPKLLRI